MNQKLERKGIRWEKTGKREVYSLSYSLTDSLSYSLSYSFFLTR